MSARTANRLLSETLRRGLAAAHLHLVERTDRGRLSALIRSLRPIRADTGLIRIGPRGDGGYLVPDDLDGIEYAYSPGAAADSGFEVALAQRGITIFAADGAGGDAPAGNEHAGSPPNFPGSVAARGPLERWKRDTIGSWSGDLLLRADVDGGDYGLLMSIPEALLRQFRVLVITFHRLDQLWNAPWFQLAERMFRELLAHHSVAHIHPHNGSGSVRSEGLEIPRVAEFTFYRKDRIEHAAFAATFPHPLDADNTARRTLVLPACWYR